MNRDLESFFGALRSFHLEEDEKGRMVRTIVEKMEGTLVREEGEERLTGMAENPSFFDALRRARQALTREEKEHMLRLIEQRMRREASSPMDRIVDFLRSMHLAPVLASLLLLVGAGTTVATAESSLPGDFLYPLKLNVNEVVYGGISLTANAKAQWAMRRTERRLEEAEILAERRGSSEGVEQQMAKEFGANVARVEQYIHFLESKGHIEEAEALSARFESSLAAHEEVLASLEESSETVRTAIGLMVSPNRSEVRQAVAAHREALARQRTRSERLEVSARMNVTVAESTLQEVQSLVEVHARTRAGAGPTISSEKLREAHLTLQEARVHMRAGRYDEAFTLARTSLKAAEEARLFLHREKTRG